MHGPFSKILGGRAVFEILVSKRTCGHEFDLSSDVVIFKQSC